MAITHYEGASERTRAATDAFNKAQSHQRSLVAKYNSLIGQMTEAKAATKAAYSELERAWEADKASKPATEETPAS